MSKDPLCLRQKYTESYCIWKQGHKHIVHYLKMASNKSTIKLIKKKKIITKKVKASRITALSKTQLLVMPAAAPGCLWAKGADNINTC